MKAKIWVNKFLFASVSLIALVGSVNFFVDPMWFFTHSYPFNNLQKGFNERIQKSANLKYADIVKYDGVLMGSSRSTFYNTADFKNKKIFNYSVSGIYPYEYNGLIEYFKRTKGQSKMDYIVLGLDFYGSQAQKNNEKKSDFSFQELEDKNTYIFKSLFSLKTFSYSLHNLGRWVRNKTGSRSYTRENFVVTDKVSEAKVKGKTLGKIKTYYSGYKTYNGEYIETLEELKSNNPDSKFVIYTTPLPEPFLDEIFHNEKLFQHYLRWIKDLTKVYGEIYFFTQYSDFACEYTSYSRDGDHYYPFIGKYILNIVSGATPDQTYKNTYTILNKNNIDHYIDGIIATRDNSEILCSHY